MKTNNDPRDNARQIVLTGVFVAMVWWLGSIPGGGRYFEASVAWFVAVLISLLLAKWILRIDQGLQYLQEIRDIAAESNRQNIINLQQNEVIESLLREIKDKM